MEENERKAECKKHIEGLRLRTCPQKQNGITLIALIITIIVMLILVGVTINVVLNGGLFTQAQEAAKNTQKEAEREELLSAVAASYEIETKTVNKEKLKSNLGEDWTVEGEGPYTVTSPKENVFTVDKNGTIDPPVPPPPPPSAYEYTLAEIIKIAKNSSIAMYENESEYEDYVEGEPYEIGMVIPFSEFWKEGTLENIKNGKKSTNTTFDIEYNVTVEKFPYIEMSENLDFDELDRGLMFAGITSESGEKLEGFITTTENCIYVYALGLTSEDNLEQIKIKIQEPEPEPPEPEFNSFTLGDLVDAGTLELDENNESTGTFNIPVAKFNEIIGQDITTLEDYLIAMDSADETKTDTAMIRFVGTNSPVYNNGDLVISFALGASGATEEELITTEFGDNKEQNSEFVEGEDPFINVAKYKDTTTNEVIIALDVYENAEKQYKTKEEVPAQMLETQLKPISSKRINKLMKKYVNN